MAFQNKNLSIIAYAGGFTLFHYTTTDSMETTIKDENYFGAVTLIMNVGDIIILNCGDGTCIRTIAKLTNTSCSLDVLK